MNYFVLHFQLLVMLGKSLRIFKYKYFPNFRVLAKFQQNLDFKRSHSI